MDLAKTFMLFLASACYIVSGVNFLVLGIKILIDVYGGSNCFK